MLKKVILCPNPYRDHELTVAKEAKRILDSVHCPNVVCVPFRNEEKPEGYGLDIRPLQQELRGADMIIAFGGDGTILNEKRRLCGQTNFVLLNPLCCYLPIVRLFHVLSLDGRGTE